VIGETLFRLTLILYFDSIPCHYGLCGNYLDVDLQEIRMFLFRAGS